ncbi:MAG: LysR substrate-binding domain-containing protein, partial [Saprospiraceae bacterium]
ITKLETELGFLLFDRQTKPISTTPNGNKFLQRARRVMLEARQLRDFALHIEEEDQGTLSIGIIPTLAPYLVPMFMPNLQQSFPGIRLTIREMMTRDIVQALIDRTIDGGIISTPIRTNLDLAIDPLFYEKFFLYVSYKHPLYKQKQVNVEDIESCDLWLLNEGNCFSDQVNNMCHLDGNNPTFPTFEYRSNSIESLRRIVEFQGGLTFLPELATLNVAPNQEDMIKRLAGPSRAREISMVMLPHAPREKQLNNLSESIKYSLPSAITRKGDKVMVKTNVNIHL